MIPQPHHVDLYRPVRSQGTAQTVDWYDLVASSIPCFIQPMDSKEAYFYQLRGIENTTTVYSSQILDYRLDDILEYGEQQYHVIGVKNGLQLNVYKEIICEEYSSDARKRLNREAYDN